MPDHPDEPTSPAPHGQPATTEDQRGENQPADAGASEEAAGVAEEIDRGP